MFASVGRVGLRSVFGGSSWTPVQLFSAGEQGVWYDPSDFSTMFQDSAGRTPVTGVEQPVGLILDKSRGLATGAELVTNGTFSGGTTTGWTSVNGSTLSVVNGFLRVTNGATNFGAAQQIITTVVGKTYKLTFTVGTQTGTSSAWIGSTLGGIEYQDFDFITSGNYTLIFTATTTTTYLRFQNRQTTIGNISDFDNISVYEIQTNPAKQATSTKRPLLSARYNLLIKTEDLSNAVWGADYQVNATVVNGVVTITGTEGYGYFSQGGTFSTTVPHRISFEMTCNQTLDNIPIRIAGETTALTALVNLVANQPKRVTIDGYIPLSNAILIGIDARDFYVPGGTNAVGYSVTFNKVDLRQMNDIAGMPPYQRVNISTDYDSSGFLPYLKFDGVDDALVSNSINAGTNKGQMFAAARTLRESIEIIGEFGTFGYEDGTFHIANLANGTYQAWSKGSTGLGVAAYRTVPVTNVITNLGDISAPSLNIRLNGIQMAESSSPQGAGGYTTGPISLGLRYSTDEFPYSGRIYGLILRFGPNLTAPLIYNAENYLGNKCGVSVPFPATSFTPADLFGPTDSGVWYDFSDLSTMFQDTTAYTPVTAVEQPVGKVLDKSGNGRHAVQTTSARRPVLSARYNALYYTEDFANAYWVKDNASVLIDQTVAPDGNTTGNKITCVGNSVPSISPGSVYQPNVSQKISISAKAGPLNFIFIQINTAHSVGGPTQASFITFDLTSGTVGTTQDILGPVVGMTGTAVSEGGGWWRCTVQFTSANGYFVPFFGPSSTANARTGVDGAFIYVWGIDTRCANDYGGVPGYQKVVTFTNYNSTGFLPYLKFDGVDDFLNSEQQIVPPGDEAQMLVGVRKLSEQNDVIMETSTNVSTQPGSMLLSNLDTGQYQGYVLGSASGSQVLYSTPAPVTNILSYLADISGSSFNLRYNGQQVAASSNSVGGNFLTYPVYLGGRADLTYPYDGRIYNAVLRFGAPLSGAQLSDAENYIAGKTGVTISAPTFTPASLFVSGAEGMWYDPSDFSTMFQDWQGTTPVTGTGQPVGKILDKSGNGNHLYQGTAGARPTLEQDGSGKYYLNFDGVNDVMFTGENSGGTLVTRNVPFFEANTHCVTAVSGIRKVSDTGTKVLFSSTQFSLVYDAFYMRTSVSGGPTSYSFQVSGSVDISDATAAGYTSPITSVLTGIGFPDNDSIIVRVNGTQVASQTSVDLGNTAFASDVFYLGNQGTALSRWYSGRLYSLVILGRAAVGTELSDTETWVNGKTGAY